MATQHQIDEAMDELSKLERFINLFHTPGHMNEVATAVWSETKISLCVYHQAYPGATNYHKTYDECWNHWLIKAVCENGEALLTRARDLCAEHVRKLRIERKAELEAELEVIKKLEAAGMEPQLPTCGVQKLSK